MRMFVDLNSLAGTQTQLVLEHNGEQTFWNVSSYNKKCFTGEIDLMVHLNQFWAKLPGFRQEKIFNIFGKIRDVFEEVYDARSILESLTPLIAELYEENNLPEIENWISFHSSIIIPEKLEDEYVYSDEKPGNREKTYLRRDYFQLVALAISLRFMIPIWGEFIYRTKRETGQYFKEFFAFPLLSKSNIMESPAMEKLRTYVLHNIQNDRSIFNTVISGVGTEDFPTWLLSIVVIRRLCIGDVSGSNKETSLITFIYNYINQKITGGSTGNFSTIVKGKDFDTGGNDDHNTSRLEGYKIKYSAPIGSHSIFGKYMDDPYRYALKIKPNINIDLLTEFLTSAKALEHEKIWQAQVVLAQIVLRNLSPRGLTHLSKKQVIDAIAVTQTLLWEAGHKVLAGLCTAIATNNEDDLKISDFDSKARIPKELIDRICDLYPYINVNETAARKKTKVPNAAILAIDELNSLFSQRDWILTLPSIKLKEITGNANVTRFSCPHDMKILLAKLVIDTSIF